jgi:3,4-dihydroxy 2-butanone 4-phosphate synthase / GTP cyclohydrolase II
MAGMSRGTPEGVLSVLIDRTSLNGSGRGVLFQAGENISAEIVNMMARHGRGVIGAALTADRAFSLGMTPMQDTRRRADAPRYMASVEARACTETGISAAERALTLRTLADRHSTADDLVSPGHIMPAIVPQKPQSDAGLEAVAFQHAARFNESLAIAWCDILNEEGAVASAAECAELSVQLSLPLLVRVGDAAVESEVLERSAQQPTIDVQSGGLDLGQFA